MRVAAVLEEGKLGGPQIYIIRLAAAMHSNAKLGGFDTVIILPIENSSSTVSLCKSADVEYKTIKISRITRELRVALRYIFLFPFETWQLTKEFRRGDFQLVYVAGGAWQYKGAIAGKLAGKKVVWHLNDTGLPWVFRKLFGWIGRVADGFIYASERSRVYYKQLVDLNKPSYVIPSPVDASFFDPKCVHFNDDVQIRKLGQSVIVGTVANVSPVKGLDVLIRSAAKLKKQGFDIQFVVIGAIYPSQQRYFSDLQKLAADLSLDNIEFVGALDDVRPLMKRFDIYLCSSNAESSPISVWEAMAMEKPVVSTDVGDVPIYVKEGESGFIVDVGDSDAMAERLSRLIKNPTIRQEFGGKAREIAVRELDISRCVERHLAAYQEILSL